MRDQNEIADPEDLEEDINGKGENEEQKEEQPEDHSSWFHSV